MSFMDDWQAELDESYAQFAVVISKAPDIEIEHGVMAAAILWPIRKSLQNLDTEALAALEDVTGEDGKKIISRIAQSWEDLEPLDDLVSVCRDLARQAKSRVELATALAALVQYFQAWENFVKYLTRILGPGVSVDKIKAGVMSFGGTINIETLQMIMGDNPPVAPGDPYNDLLPFEPRTVEIPGGPGWIGRDEQDGVPEWETPKSQVKLPAYRIGVYPVTNEQFMHFVRATKKQPASELDWNHGKPLDDRLYHPVRGVTWFDAMQYCRWLSGETGRTYTLPSEAQWEKAARGPEGFNYPWGDEWDPTRCNHGQAGTTPVTRSPDYDQPFFPQGASSYGCYDMAGNVREWTTTLWGIMRPRPDPSYDSIWAADGRDDIQAGEFVYRVYKGGASLDAPSSLRCDARAAFIPTLPGPPQKGHGFRVVATL